MLALIDADELIYKAVTTPISFLNEAEEVETQDIETLSDAVSNLNSFIATWQEKSGATDVVLCFSCQDRKLYRKHFYPEYKANRIIEKPKWYWELIEHAKENFEWVEEPGLEADDVMGVLHTGVYPDSIIVSSDKDMDTVPGKRYSPYHDKFFETSEYIANYNWLAQTLSGDSSDGYKGAKGIGKGRAAEVLAVTKMAKDFDMAYDHVMKMFKNRDHTTEEAIGNFICARIPRFSDIKREGDTIYVDIPMIETPFYVSSVLASM